MILLRENNSFSLGKITAKLIDPTVSITRSASTLPPITPLRLSPHQSSPQSSPKISTKREKRKDENTVEKNIGDEFNSTVRGIDNIELDF